MLTFISFDRAPFPLIYFTPAIAGLAVGWIIYRVDEDCAGSGVRCTLEYIIGEKPPKLVTVPFKFIATILTIGSGGSGGIDGPALQMGYGLGNYVTYVFRFADRDAAAIIRICGAAAALGAILIVTEMSGLSYAAPAALAAFVAYVLAWDENILEYKGYVGSEEWI